MNCKKLIQMFQILTLWAITVASVYAQRTLPDVNIFDLKIRQNAGGESNLEVSWYPPSGMNNFIVEYRGGNTGESQQISIRDRNFVQLNNIDPDKDYVISVTALDANENILAHSPVEKWLGRRSRRKLSSRSVSTQSMLPLTPTLNATLISLDSNTFPFIFTTLKVDTSGIPVQGLTAVNFTAFEDNQNQTDFFDVTPVNGGNNRIVDFIFIFDNSGSMCPKQKSVKANIRAFIDSLTARQIDVRLGAVRFGQAGDGEPILMNSGHMTDDVDFFKTLFDLMTCDGGREPGLNAIYQAATSFSFRPGSQRHFLLITDEDSDDGDLAQTISVCKNNGITVHTAVDTTWGTTVIDYSGPNSIRAATNGELFNVMEPYDKILRQIDNVIRSTYIVRYRTFIDIFNGQQREVRIEVNAFGQAASVTGQYTPGAAPQIQRTQATIDLSKKAQIAGTPLPIEARITDSVAPFVQTATVFYRTSGSADYRSLIMTLVSEHTYKTIIPDTAVITPGVDYYITATDGQATSSDPAVDPGTLPYQIAILPNEPPQITHTPVTNGRPGEDILVSAVVFDTTAFLDKVELQYREIGMLLYEIVPMTSMGESKYEAIIPGNKMTNAGLQYFIRAVDNLGLASVHGTHTIFPGDCITALLDDFSDGDASGWIPHDSTRWEVSQVNNNFAYCIKEANDSGDEYSLFPVNWKNFTLSLDAQAADNQNMVVIFAVQSFENSTAQSYYLQLSNDGVVLNRSTAPDSSIVIASASGDFVSDGQYHQIQITRQLPGIEVVIDGQKLITVNDETFTEGLVGMGAYKARAYFDNVNISSEKCSNKIFASITIPSNQKVEVGTTLSVPIITSVLKDIVRAQFTVEYDGNALQFDSATTGSDVPGFKVSELSLNPPFTPTTPGTNKNLIVQISAVDSSYFVGMNKETVSLKFSVVGNVGGTSPLALDSDYNHTFLTTTDSVKIFGRQLMFSHGDITIIPVTNIDDRNQERLPTNFALRQNYPNPFNPETTIEYQIPERTQVLLKIYNLMGQEIVTLVNEEKMPGLFRVKWDGRDFIGKQVSSGIYVYQIKAGNFVKNHKLILMR